MDYPPFTVDLILEICGGSQYSPHNAIRDWGKQGAEVRGHIQEEMAGGPARVEEALSLPTL